MFAQDTGIILKKLSAGGQTFAVISQKHGRINLVVLEKNQKKQLRSGSIIGFNARAYTSTLFATDHIELRDGLSTKQAPDLYWIHHLLEICYYFLPLHQPALDIFAFMYGCTTLLKNQHFFDPDWHVIQKITISCLFLLLGFAPPPLLTHSLTTTKTTVLLFIDFTKEQKLELCKHYLPVLNKIPLADLDRWALQCIQSHPNKQLFRTIQFVYPPQP